MTYEQLKALYERRAAVWSQATALLDESADREWTAEDATKWDALNAELAEHDRQIDHAERERTLDASSEERSAETEEDTGTSEEQYRSAFDAYVRNGIGSVTPAQREALTTRAQSVGTDSEGGYVVADEYWARLVETMKAYSDLSANVNVITTATGANLPWPTADDTGNVGSIISENTQLTEQDVTFGTKSIDSFTYTSKLVRVSLQLLQDSAFSIDEYLGRKLGERLARVYNQHITVGTGTNQPDGILVGATSGVTTSSATAISHDELIDLQHSVDPAYRGMNSRFMFNDATLGELRKVTDGDGNKAWAPGLQPGVPGTLLGSSYIINQDAPNMATGNLGAIAFGDFRTGYVMRQVRGVQLVRLAERYADYLQVGFFAFGRIDGTKDDLNAYRVTTQG